MLIGVEMVSAGSGLSPGKGGMRTYYQGMVTALAAQAGPDEVVTFTAPRYEPVPLPYGNGFRAVACRGAPAGRFGRVVYEHSVLGLLARSKGIDVLLSTHNVRPLLWRRPSVIVLQSLQNFLLRDRARARDAYLRMAMPPSLRSADRVIAVSEAARADAIRIFDLDPDRVVSVHHGCSPWAMDAAAVHREEGRPEVPPPLGDTPYILNVSSLYGLKNHRGLIEAFGLMAARTDLPHDLVIAGGDSDVTRAELAEVARGAGVAGRVRLLGRYPQEHLPALYANASAVAYPSFYETFGHPVLEAFAFERPLLTSAVGGTAEVAGPAAILVDPEDPQEIASGLERVVSDEALRTRLVAAGAARLKDFSWDACGRRTLQVLRDAAAVESPGREMVAGL
jgi:glycosyltransferase involved in cell wall biosynthesis